ncbi:glycine zipper domain-containing protein [Tsuneonella amylolytica]|uniref:glycine zipper domain-containing protein n=1 Tax=Tsuneonella amylolytica TaxID=2338327 RepID=UPI0018929A85|nr:glycine zipper domain-containing protein [Tsuneonella amylolytica]
MRMTLLVLAAAALPLGACTSYNNDSTLRSAGTGAAIGAAGGAGIAAIAGGNLLTGAAIGAAVGGLSGAVWADRNNDGQTDGYTYNGQYYEGAPAGYTGNSAGYDTAYATPARQCQNVGSTALKTGAAGAAVGAGAGALIGGLGVLEGAAIGAAVGGLGGAVWADSNNDGCVDGYIREGQYYSGSPVVQPTNTTYTGERG